MAFKLKSGNRPTFKEMGSSPLNYNSPLQQDKDPKGKIIYKDGKKYYQAADGSLHTGQVSDYEMEKMEDARGVGSGGNRKVMKDGPKNKVHGLKKGDTWTNRHAKKSDAQRKADEKKHNYSKMTKEEKAKLQKEAEEKARKWRESDEYKRRRKEADKKTKKVNDKIKKKKKIDTTQIDLLKKNNRYTKAN